MIDKPLYGNPLAGGSGTLDRLSEKIGGANFRQEGDMARYVAFNDPGQPGAGYSNLHDYLAAGNQMPQLPNREPLKSVSNANMFMGNATLPNLPPSLSELNPIKGGAKNPMDEYQRGYLDSDFYSPRSTTDVQKFNYKGKDMQGSGTYVSGFENYLNSIGQGDLFKRPPNELMSQELATIGGPTPPPGFGTPMNPFPGQIDTPEQLIESGQFTSGVGQDVTGNNPMEIPVPSSPYNRVGQQLMGPNQDDILGTLKNIEQGIASLGQGGMNQSSFGGFNNNFGIGSFFPPYGGMYG